MRKILCLTFICYVFVARAQFFTIQSGKEVKHNDKESVFLELQKMQAAKKDSLRNSGRNEIQFFSVGQGHEIVIERDIPLFVNATDSLMLGLLVDRMDVCLPLDFLVMNSGYGYRTDPITRCMRFHDGIDLRCRHAKVYAMLPAVVRKVHYGKDGYGNYVVLDHGDFQCLYGHLSMVAVREGQRVEAGTVVGISGSTGRSTGEHLHVKLSKLDGKSLNPEPFIAYLNDYIGQLQDRMAYLKFGTLPPVPLNLENLAKALDKYNVKFPKIVMAQALLETGYFTSHVCRECNNLFGLRRPGDGSYYVFGNWEESVKAYKEYVQYKYKSGDYLTFLRDIGYATDKNYIIKVLQIASALQF
jgi:hypothetical protein